MALTLQEYFATATQKAADDLLTAYERIPSEKRDWAPEESSRTALDMVAECALLNGYTADLITTQKWPTSGYDEYLDAKNELKQSWETVKAALDKNTAALIATIKVVKDEDLTNEIELQWGKRRVADLISYSYWNMSYHEGQINYIASMLGCLK